MGFQSPLHEPDRHRERRALGAVGKTGHTAGLAQSHRGVEDELRGVGGTHETRAAAGHHDTRGQQPVEAALPNLFARHHEDLLHARADDLREEATRQRVDAIAPDLAHLDLLARVYDLGQRVSVVELQGLGLVERRAQADGDVAGHVIAADREHRQPARGAVVVNDDGGRAGADVDQADAEVQLLGREHALAGGQSRADDVLDVEAGAVHAFDDVLDRGLRAGDDVGLHLQPVARHAVRVTHAFLAVDRVGARDGMDDLAVGGDANGARSLDHALHVVLADLAVAARHGDDAGRILRPQVRAAQGDDDGLDPLPGHALGGDGRGLDGRDGLVEVDDHALAQAIGRALAHPDDAHGSVRLVRLGYDHCDPARAKVETDGSLPPRQCCAGTPPGTYGYNGRADGIIRASGRLRARFCGSGPRRG